MRAGWIRRMLIGLLLIPIACASSRLSTHDIYAELLWGGGGVTCTPSAIARLEQRQDERFHDRMIALRPYMEAEIGRAELTRMQDAYREEIASTDFIGCPSEEEHSRRRTRVWTLLHELENRSRRAHAIEDRNGHGMVTP